LAIRFALLDLAFVAPASTAQTGSLWHRAMVQARVSKLGSVVVLRRSVRSGFPPPGSREKVAERETPDG
jgi:hypothetical protein